MKFLGDHTPFSLATPLIIESSCNDFLYNEHPTHGLSRFTMSLRKFFTSAGDEDDDNSENEDGPGL